MPARQDERTSHQKTRLPTSIDVAALANVSQSTVSRALRGDRSIGDETRQRVVRIASELGYQPDSRAVRLREGSAGAIAVVLLFPQDDERQSINPFYYDIVAAVEAAAAARGIGVLFSGQSNSSSLRGDFEQRREADGVIVIGTATNREGWDFFARAHREGANVVGWGAPDDSLPTVRADNRRAGELAAAHLISLGRRRLAFVGPGWESHAAFRLRREGFLAELARHGLPDFSVDFILKSADRGKQGEASIEAVLADRGELDGVFAASDLLAAGVMRGLAQKGHSIPDEVAVVGFDGGQGARNYTPPLTTIEQDVARAGELLVSALLAGRSAAGRSGTVPVKLAIRESSQRT